MAPLIDVKVDEAKLRNVQRMLRNIPNALPRVMSRAINKTAAPVKTSMARQLVGPLNAEAAAIGAAQKKSGRKTPAMRFKVSIIKGNIKLQKATYRVWQALIWIKRYKGQVSTEPAFIAKMPSGNKSIFKRLGASRLPIADQLRRLMLERFKGIGGRVRQEAQQRLDRNINDQVKLALMKWKSSAGRAA